MAIQGVRLSTSNYLSTAASQYFQPGRTLTVMCWARPGTLPPTSNYYTLLGTTTSAGVSGWGVSIQGGAGGTAFWEMFFTNNGSAYDDFRFTNGVATGRWDHVAWVMRSDATEAGYLNGKQETLVQSANAGTYPAAASRTLQIKWGDATGNGTFDGALAYVRIFDGELSGPEIRAEMMSRRAVNKRVHLIAEFPLEMVGGTSSIVAPDIGPHGLHVTGVTGTVTWDRDPPLPKLIVPPIRQFRLFSLSAGGAQSALLGTATETDTAGTFGRAKAKALGVATETDTAQTLTRLKARALGVATETDTAGTLTRAKARALGTAAETDAAQSLSRRKAAALGIASETDTAGTFAHGTAAALGTAVETDTAGALTRSKARQLGAAGETDTAGTLTAAKRLVVGVAADVSTAVALVEVKSRLLGTAGESDSASSFGHSWQRTLGVATETDAALVITPPASGQAQRPTMTHVAGPQRAVHVAGSPRATHVAGPQRLTRVGR